MINQTAEYAVRAIAELAARPGKPRSTHQIAKATGVPPDYLSKVLKELARAGIVRSHRGVHGGFTLARDPDRLPVRDVIHAVSPIQRITECPLGRKEHAHGALCPLHRLLDDAMETIEAAFSSVTIGELTRSGAQGHALDSPIENASQPVVQQAERPAALRTCRPRSMTQSKRTPAGDKVQPARRLRP